MRNIFKIAAFNANIDVNRVDDVSFTNCIYLSAEVDEIYIF